MAVGRGALRPSGVLLFTGVAMVTGLVRKCANSLPHRAELWPILHIFIVLIIIKSFIINDFCFFLLKKNNVVGGGAEHPWEKIGTDLFHFRGREYIY